MMRGALRELLASLGQIYFQGSPAFGLVLLLALCLCDSLLACGGLVCAAASSGAAWIAGFPAAERKQGRYGFNGALSGIGLCATYQFGAALLVWLVVVGVLTGLLSRAAQRARLPILSSLFVLSMWLSASVAPELGIDLRRASQLGGAFDIGLLGQTFAAVGAISFLNSTAVSVLLIAVLASQDRRGAAWLVCGAAFGGVLASVLCSWSSAVVPSHAAAVNGALTGLGLRVHAMSPVWRIGGIAVSTVFCLLFANAGIPAYTAPFILASWLMLWWCGGLLRSL